MLSSLFTVFSCSRRRFLTTAIAVSLWMLSTTHTSALVSNQPVSKLLQEHSATIAKLKDTCKATVGEDEFQRQPYCNDVFYLRYCMNDADDDVLNTLQTNLKWRMSSQGQTVCGAAVSAIEQATATAGRWNNDPVMNGAPSASKITKYITPKSAMTTTSNQDDLVYCIRAGSIDDASLMSEVTVDEMIDFFLYAKEVNAIIANQRSLDLDKLLYIITCNDLSGVKLVGGSSDFRKALSASSNQANELYPSTAGPTLLCNLPKLLSALVKLFTPLFSKAVKERLKFEQGPLRDVEDLRQVASSNGGGPAYAAFAKQLDGIIYK